MEKKIVTLFISYLEKDISKQDEDYLMLWINENPDYLNKLNEFRKLWKLAGAVGEINNEIIENEWKLFVGKIDQFKQPQPKNKTGFMYWLPRVAAIFLLGAVISAAITYTIINTNNNELVYQEINAPAGAKSIVTLPDGSIIWLNAGSSVKYSNQFGKKQREIFLTGEAFFEVAKNKRKLFVVQASDLSIKAYGTSFNVKSYPDENTVETTLIEGSIGVKRNNLKGKIADEVILHPNQRVVYYKPSKQIKTAGHPEEEIAGSVPVKRETQKLTYMISKGIDPLPFTSWKDGRLFFDSENLSNLAIKLERKYDVKIHFENETLKALKFSGSLENETVEQVIEAIGIAAHIDYEIKDRDITFKEKAQMKKSLMN